LNAQVTVLTAECEQLRGQVEHEHQLNLDAMEKIQKLESDIDQYFNMFGAL